MYLARHNHLRLASGLTVDTLLTLLVCTLHANAHDTHDAVLCCLVRLWLLSDNTSRFIEANQQAFEWLATADDDNGDGRHTKTQLRKVLQKWEQHGWELTRGVELMWDGERTEHVVVEDADSNSKHVLRAILRAFEAFSSPSPPAPASGTSVQRERAATNRHGQKLQQVLAFTGCTEEVALDCLDATSGNVEQASILALDAVGREERKR